MYRYIVQMLRILLKNMQSHPRGENLWVKFQISTVLRAVFLHFCPDKGEIWHRGVAPCQISRLSEQRVCGAKNPFLNY